MTHDYRNRLKHIAHDSSVTTNVSSQHGTSKVKIADIQLTMMYRALMIHPRKLTRTQPPAVSWWRQVFNLKGNKEKLLPQARAIVKERLANKDGTYINNIIEITT